MENICGMVETENALRLLKMEIKLHINTKLRAKDAITEETFVKASELIMKQKPTHSPVTYEGV